MEPKSPAGAEVSPSGDSAVVQIMKAVVDSIKRHGAGAYPEEGCGFLIGPDAAPRRIDEFRAATNIETEGRALRYRVDPRETPDHPARPSVTDLERGFTWYTYVIVAVEKGRPVDLRAWGLEEREERRAFREVGIELV